MAVSKSIAEASYVVMYVNSLTGLLVTVLFKDRLAAIECARTYKGEAFKLAYA